MVEVMIMVVCSGVCGGGGDRYGGVVDTDGVW